MGDVAISVRGLGKRYTLGAAGTRAPYQTFRDTVTRAITRPFRRGAARGEPFWALKDVSFEVKPGEVVGIIGRNGAGKSTLLKLLSRITEPTEGEADIHGRVGSLLEVGTGFHPELSGRENVYLNGAILGMGRREIARKFDEMVAFAEVEKFIDTPVKFYSSGMYMRLAFAVAAHLDPEILIVDEVLAVGDAGFQKKCLGKMGDVAKGGRTVLFVSHNMQAVQQLAPRSVWLHRGRVEDIGTTPQVLARYHKLVKPQDVYYAPERPERAGTTGARGSSSSRRACVAPAGGGDWAGVTGRYPVRVRCPCSRHGSDPAVPLQFHHLVADVGAGRQRVCPHMEAPTAGHERTYRVRLAGHRLAPGEYYLRHGHWPRRQCVRRVRGLRHRPRSAVFRDPPAGWCRRDARLLVPDLGTDLASVTDRLPD
jgi:ABC-type polysaccharide/polyol phosphate transport system ATPase subunit